MLLELMGFEVHLRIEDDELLLLAFLVQAWEVISPKVLLERIVIEVILRIVAASPPIAQMASFVFVSAMGEQFVIAIEPLPAKSALRMPFETALVDGSRVVITELLVPLQFLRCEELVFMREDLLVARAQVA